MVYVPLLTAGGHRITVNPKKQPAVFCSLLEAQLAESRFVFKERQADYEKYRARRGRVGNVASSVSITKTVRDQFDRLDDATFGRLDAGIMAVAKQPARTGSQPKHYRWFLGDLRRAMVDEFPVVYTIAQETPKLRILLVGFRNWRNPATASQKSAGNSAKRYPVTKDANGTRARRQRQNITDQFVAYAGESAEELLAYPEDGQHDALVQAFREGIQQKAENKGDRTLTSEEKVVLAVTALEQEINNGGTTSSSETSLVSLRR